MRFFIETHHPGDIHFWKFPIRELIGRGHEILMVSRERDVMRRLVESYDWIPHVIPKRHSQKNKFPLVELLSRQLTIARTINRFKPDVVASLFGSYCQSAWMMNIPNIIFTDSEFQHFNHRIAHPFATEIHTPYCFYKNLGSKQRFYKGIHELSFLDGRNWMPDKEKLKDYPLLAPRQYIIIRLSSWNTFHDINERGMGSSALGFIEEFKQRFKIVISAEEQNVPSELRQYAVDFPPEDFHHLLGFARFVLTEGASTASEAACLGIPTVYINSTEPRGYLEMLQDSYGLVRNFQQAGEGLPEAIDWLNDISEDDLDRFQARRTELVNDHCNVTEYVVKTLEAAITSRGNPKDKG